MKKILVFACKHGRPRDIPLLREGARAAGWRFVVAIVPLAYPVLVLAALGRWLGFDVAVVISDVFRGDRWMARLFGQDCARMFWNYADEFPATLNAAPARRVCFFEDAGQPVQLFRFAPQPIPAALTAPTDGRIVFVGDVNLDNSLPQGLAWWEERLHALYERHGFVFYLTPDYQQLIAGNLATPPQQRRARVLAKNLLRLWIVQATRRQVGDRLQLVGSNWRKFGLEAQPSAYSLQARLALYSQAAVNLDCGSKSGDSALYPRSSEVISYAGAPLQVVCADSAVVYGARLDECSFDNEATLFQRLDRRLSETAEQRTERACWLAQHLRGQHLTMADSLRELFKPGAAISQADTRRARGAA